MEVFVMRPTLLCSMILAASLSIAGCGSAAPATATVTAAPAPHAFSSFKVRVVGSGKPMLLIPGLGCSGNVWESTAAHFAGRYQLHIVTLAGFGGEPAPKSASLDAVRRDLLAYIAAARLDHPVVVGHSLGGFMAYWLAATAPDAIGAVVALDGVPFLGEYFTPGATVETSRPGARKVESYMASLAPEPFAAETRQALAMMITDPKDLEAVAKDSTRSSPAMVGARMAELLTTDLRESVARIEAPTLFVGSGAGAKTATERDALFAHAERQLAKIPRHTVVVASGARHFVMLDAPEFVFSTIDAFLARNGV
jgi:pimeloyl-ACP methyl ester carboxylesterase